MSPNTPKNVDDYISRTEPATQETLVKLRQVIVRSAPKAVEKISYGMPFYEYGGVGIKGRMIYFAAFKKHISLFITPWRSNTLPNEINKYHATKATYQFKLSEPFPFELIEETVLRLVAERE